MVGPFASQAPVDPIVAFMREERVRQGLNQTELAKLTRQGQAAICQAEQGVCSPKLCNVVAVLAALGYELAIIPLEEDV